ncbi:MAG TPA: hypothetical protein VFU22_19565 [Roseiflexaceae bacterium]|nr:hypothetical protein [Roseiflexaceae bacterium]
MKLRLALGLGALALLIAALAAWDGFDQPALSGRILELSGADLPALASDGGGAAFSLCVPRAGTLSVHVLPFTRVLDARGRLFTTAARLDALEPGQRVQIWTTDEPAGAAPREITAVKIKITGNASAGADPAEC